MPRYYITLENIWVPQHLQGTRAISAISVEELIYNIIEDYGFHHIYNMTLDIQLWSAPMGSLTRKRLDVYKYIPKDNEFIWVRIVNTKLTET